MPAQQFDPSLAVYTPPEVADIGTSSVREAEQVKGTGAILGISEIDGYFAPLPPGGICALIAQTSNNKSGSFDNIATENARLMRSDGRTDECVVVVSVEDMIEEQAYTQISKYSGEDAGAISRGEVQDWSKLKRAADIVAGIPIFRIGASLARGEHFPNLTMTNMVRALMYMRDEVLGRKLKIGLILFDYLQAFPIDEEHKGASRETQRRLQVRSDFYRARAAAMLFKAPVFIAVQARQQLQGANPPIMLPGVYDGEESSAIAQRADRVVTQWMPARTYTVGERVSKGRVAFTVEEPMLMIKVAKQRGRLPAGRSWLCNIDFKTNRISPLPLAQWTTASGGGPQRTWNESSFSKRRDVHGADDE